MAARRAAARLERQLGFIVEIDRLKQVLRRSYLIDGSRRENSAEHSWHVAMLAMVLAEHSDRPVNMLKLLTMLLVHDIVEVDAGDTYCYDQARQSGAARRREQKAATRLFGLLPADQARALRRLWEEFEAGRSAEARLAGAVDRLMPLLHNVFTQGRSWREHGITRDLVLSRNDPVRRGSARLWARTVRLIDDAVAKGYLAR